MALGVVETALGVGILIYGNRLYRFYLSLQDSDILVHPNNLLVEITENVIPNLFHRRYYIVSLLLLLGLTKLVTSIGLSRHHLWASYALSFLVVLLLPFEFGGLLLGFSLYKLAYFILNLTIAIYLLKKDQII